MVYYACLISFLKCTYSISNKFLNILPSFILIPFESYLQNFACHIAATMIKFIVYDVQKLLPWLCREVAMVKAVIKAIKAAGVGLNGSSGCLCCHK